MPTNLSVCPGSNREERQDGQHDDVLIWSAKCLDEGMRDEHVDVRQCALAQSPALLSIEVRQVDHDAWYWPWLC